MFIHLNCHSHYSFLRGVGSPEELVAAAAQQGMAAVALTDTNGMYAAVNFYQAAQKAGVKPIVGVTLDVEAGGEFPQRRPAARDSARDDGHTHSAPVVLLAESAEGYSNLCRLVTLRKLGRDAAAQGSSPEVARPGSAAEEAEKDEILCAPEEGKPLILEDLAEHSRGVIALCPPPGRNPNTSDRRGTIDRAPTKETLADSDRAGHLARMKEIFGERLYLETRLLGPGDVRGLREAERIGREMGVPLAATNNVHFLRPEEHLHHRAVNAIRTGGLLTTVSAAPAVGASAPEITTGEAWFKPAAEMEQLFANQPGGAEALRATAEIAARCNLELELGRTIFPEFPVPEGETPFSYLWKQSFEGARRRYRPLQPLALARLTRELEVIETLGLAPYFLLVWDIVEEARRRGIPAVARGSRASSVHRVARWTPGPSRPT